VEDEAVNADEKLERLEVERRILFEPGSEVGP
jgi:hypothetical protein